MNKRNFGWTAGAVLGVLMLAGAGCISEKQDVQTGAAAVTPSVSAENQAMKNGIITIGSVVAAESGWITIHVSESGKPGRVIAESPIAAGENRDVKVNIPNPAGATPELFAMLHADKGTPGVYEFPGADVPVLGEDTMPVMVAFVVMGDSAAPANTKTMAAKPPETKTFSLTAKRWAFDPSTITVNKGDHVKLSIKSVDVTHGFALPDFDVTQSLRPGEMTVVEFTASKIGTFSFFCSIFCGAGHSDMRGTLIVK